MILNIYSVYDSVAGFYGTPFYALTNDIAIRSFSMLVNDPNSQVFYNPADFCLYHLGTFSDSTGVSDNVNPPDMILRATSVAKRPTINPDVNP